MVYVVHQTLPPAPLCEGAAMPDYYVKRSIEASTRLIIVTQFVFTIYLYIRVGFHSQANHKVVDKFNVRGIVIKLCFDASTIRGMSLLIATGSINFFSSCCLSIF